MECLQAQQLLSEAADSELVDAGRLAEARRHCAECAECTAFARGLLVLRTPGPKAPESLITSVMAAVEREADQKAAAEAAAAAAAAATTATDGEAVSAADSASATPSASAAHAPVRPRPPKWRSGWGIAAAAAILVGFALLTQYGIGMMNDPFGKGREATQQVAETDAGAGTAAAPQSESWGTGQDRASKSAGESYDALAKAPSFVVFEGRVYRMQGARETSGAVPATVGRVKTARDTEGAAEDVTAYADPANPNGFLLAGNDPQTSFVAFIAVTRTVKGTTYVLSSEEDIERFGDWPALPSAYPEPATPDGSPIFFEAGTDDAGVKIFAPRGSGIESGIAIAPSQPPTDPAAGNPNWTWWKPWY